MLKICIISCVVAIAALWSGNRAIAAPPDGDWEVTPASEAALDRGLKWLAENQGGEGNWDSQDLGLVSMGALAFLAAGHTPGHGKYGAALDRSLSYVLKNAKPSGLLNIVDKQRDMYNHGLTTFVLGQAHGMTNDPRISPVLDRALKLIASTQCKDGGWDYEAKAGERGHDLSLAVMQAKALRSAVDSGLEVPTEVTDLAIKSVRSHYSARGGNRSELEMKREPGRFTYGQGGQGPTTAMAACGVVCLQEFGQYDDWRIPKSMEPVIADVKKLDKATARDGKLPFDAYTLYYVGQALYQVGGTSWRQNYPILRDYLVAGQAPGAGYWRGGRVSGRADEMYGTAVACFILAIPNRYLPILQEGKIDSLKSAVKPETP